MSNSIWHDRYVELPEDVFANSVRPYVIAVDENKKIIGANYGLRGSIPEIKYWARIDDLIAQADKAERLQKAVDVALQVLDNLTEIGGVDLQIIKIKKLIKENQ